MKTVICSHGFGVDATGCGLFTEIAAAFVDYNFVMFDYNTRDEQGNMTVLPLNAQAKLLQQKIDETSKTGDTITLLCHSQGCVVAAMADIPKSVKVIFLAPPDNLDIPRFTKVFGGREGTVFNLEGTSVIPRNDGTKTFIGKDYLHSVATADIRALFEKLAQQNELTIIKADADEIVGPTDFSDIKAAVLSAPGSHNFTDDARAGLIQMLRDLL